MMGKTTGAILYHLRRLIVSRHALLISAGALVLLSRGAFSDLRPSPERLLPLSVAGVMTLLLVTRLLQARPLQEPAARDRTRAIETGLVALVTVYVGIQATGGSTSLLQPLAYLALVVLVGFNERWAGITLALLAIGLQATLQWAAGELPHNPRPLLARAAFLAAFSMAGFVFLQLEVARRRRQHRRQMDSEIASMREEARDFRLISSALSSQERRDRSADEEKLAQGAVETIHQSMYFVLELLKKSLDLQTCVLLWLDESGDRLRIKELVSDSDLVREIPISAQAGVLGGVVKNRLLLNLRRPPRGARGIPYYGGPEQVGSFVGVPVLEDEHLRGVLCADRRDEAPFSGREEHLLVEASRQILRSIQTERVFAAMERSKYEHERFYKASSMLNSALTLKQVYATALEAAGEMALFDFAALTLYDPGKHRHVICCARGQRSEAYEGQSYRENAGLVAMVVKNKHFLPAGEELRERDTVVFTRKLRLRGMESLLVLPLIVKDQAIGSFVLAARTPGAFAKNTREMLGVICNQVAVAIENAKMYKRMEQMATTDGLTGLPNHRTFQNRLEEMLHRAERHDKPVSVVLTDIDKFKLVNDTYGHPVGDAVLRRLGQVMAKEARKVDLVARYGGEEFGMVLEETDSVGARKFCERLREEVAAQIMTSDKGPFRITLSLGIASYPADGNDKQLLIERADQALYAAKQTGRNRSVCYSRMPAVPLASDTSG